MPNSESLAKITSYRHFSQDFLVIWGEFGQLPKVRHLVYIRLKTGWGGSFGRGEPGKGLGVSHPHSDDIFEITTTFLAGAQNFV